MESRKLRFAQQSVDSVPKLMEEGDDTCNVKNDNTQQYRTRDNKKGRILSCVINAGRSGVGFARLATIATVG